jgi:putative endonuclease
VECVKPYNQSDLSLTTYQSGVDAEEKALAFFMKKGYGCVARRLKTPRGELDLILEKDRQLLFVEVKKRKSLQASLFCLLDKQKSRLQESAAFFLQVHEERWDEVRFDFVGLDDKGDLCHIPNAMVAGYV